LNYTRAEPLFYASTHVSNNTCLAQAPAKAHPERSPCAHKPLLLIESAGLLWWGGDD